MSDFMIHFLVCNILISGIAVIFPAAGILFQKFLSPRMRYNLWFLFSALLFIPFLPFPLPGFQAALSRLGSLRCFSSADAKTLISGFSAAGTTEAESLIYDLSLSIYRKTPDSIGLVLFAIWISGMLIILLFLIRSARLLRALKHSSLPLQNPEVRRLYQLCLKEAGIAKNIPVRSSAFLRSPVIAGLWRPCIYLPIHLILACDPRSLRYMLLHELQHYRQKDCFAGILMNTIRIAYWFNPFVLCALKKMRTDRETACDASVLNLLEETEYISYGNTLIDLAEKVSPSPFSLTAGIGGDTRQIRERILHIASYKKPAPKDKWKSAVSFALIFVAFSFFIPTLSIHAADTGYYRWQPSSENIALKGLPASFGAYEGSFVLYDLRNDAWNIYDMEHAVRRVSPDSTYKIYDALFALEEGIITPSDSLISWDKTAYPFEEWNRDQRLDSALAFSVNWYFQALDSRLGAAVVNRYIQETGYGNKDMSGSLSSYWLESSLKISPIEQVELLTKLYTGDLGFSPEHTSAVENAIRISSSEKGTLYGKTGTGSVNDRDINGWFIGYVETADNTYFFAVNITDTDNANGSNASNIALSLLSAEGIL